MLTHKGIWRICVWHLGGWRLSKHIELDPILSYHDDDLGTCAVLLRGCPYGEEDLTTVLSEVRDPLILRRPKLPTNCAPRLVELLQVVSLPWSMQVDVEALCNWTTSARNFRGAGALRSVCGQALMQSIPVFGTSIVDHQNILRFIWAHTDSTIYLHL